MTSKDEAPNLLYSLLRQLRIPNNTLRQIKQNIVNTCKKKDHNAVNIIEFDGSCWSHKRLNDPFIP